MHFQLAWVFQRFTVRESDMLHAKYHAETAAGVIDLRYAISDKIVPWPGDARAFEATVNATVEKNGYFTRSFWMLEHFGRHMDAAAKLKSTGLGRTFLEFYASE